MAAELQKAFDELWYNDPLFDVSFLFAGDLSQFDFDAMNFFDYNRSKDYWLKEAIWWLCYSKTLSEDDQHWCIALIWPHLSPNQKRGWKQLASSSGGIKLGYDLLTESLKQFLHLSISNEKDFETFVCNLLTEIKSAEFKSYFIPNDEAISNSIMSDLSQ